MLRPFRFARIALEAETLRFRYMTKRLVTRLVMGVLGLVMVFAAFVCGHAAAWYWLSGVMDRPYAHWF
jgi:hypothetical protein